jgi:predicted GIY-YIG superfamily endonuclease
MHAIQNPLRVKIDGKLRFPGHPRHPFNLVYLKGGYRAVWKAMGKSFPQAAATMLQIISDPDQQRMIEEDRSLFVEADEAVERKPEGFLYIVTNSFDPGWVKIGTTRNLKRRMQQYNNGRTPSWIMHYYTKVSDRFSMEREWIFHMEQEGYAKARQEFFEAKVEDALRVLKSYLPREHPIYDHTAD